MIRLKMSTLWDAKTKRTTLKVGGFKLTGTDEAARAVMDYIDQLHLKVRRYEELVDEVAFAVGRAPSRIEEPAR